MSGRRKEVALAVAVSAAGVVLSLPFVGVTAWVDFAAAVLRHSELYQAQGYNAAPLHAFLPIVPEITWMALAAVAMAACGRAEPRRMVAGSIAGFLLLWPVLWIHYAALALVALALLAPDARRPVLALIYALFALPFHPTWLAAGVLLVLVSLRGPATSRAPDWNARAVMPKPGFQANRQT